MLSAKRGGGLLKERIAVFRRHVCWFCLGVNLKQDSEKVRRDAGKLKHTQSRNNRDSSAKTNKTKAPPLTKATIQPKLSKRAFPEAIPTTFKRSYSQVSA